MIETVCANCKEPFVIIVGTNEDHVCMTCGSPLCDECYDEVGATCAKCEVGQDELSTLASESDETDLHSGECIECGRYSSRLSLNNLCEGCVMQAMIDQQRA